MGECRQVSDCRRTVYPLRLSAGKCHTADAQRTLSDCLGERIDVHLLYTPTLHLPTMTSEDSLTPNSLHRSPRHLAQNTHTHLSPSPEDKIGAGQAEKLHGVVHQTRGSEIFSSSIYPVFKNMSQYVISKIKRL